MRILPSRLAAVLAVALLAAGIALGGALPALPDLLRQTLMAAGIGRPPSADGSPDPDRAAAPPKAAHADGAPAEGAAPDPGVIRMRPDQVTGQDIATRIVAGGTLARHLLVPGTITPDTDRIARVPARVVGTVAEMRKRLGDAVGKDEVVAILDSREVADAKSEYLTAQVQAELQTINFERQQKLLASRSASEAAFETARAAYLETRLRVDLARQKLSALGLDAAEVASAQKRDEATPNQSTLRRYPLRAPLAGRIVERRVDVGTAVGKEGDPADLYTVADLSTVWIELSVPTLDLAQVREGAPVAVTPGRPGDAQRRAEGRVIFVSPFLNADTRSARVVVDPAERRPRLAARHLRHRRGRDRAGRGPGPDPQGGRPDPRGPERGLRAHGRGFRDAGGRTRPVRRRGPRGHRRARGRRRDRGRQHVPAEGRARQGRRRPRPLRARTMISRILAVSVRQRWLVVLLVLLAAGFGAAALTRLPIDAVPDITNNQVQINTLAPSLSPVDVERQVTYPVETALAGIKGLEVTRSLSRNGFSQVTAVFAETLDIYFARQQVAERLSQAREDLPPGVEPRMGPISTGLGRDHHVVGPVRAAGRAQGGAGGPAGLAAGRELPDPGGPAISDRSWSRPPTCARSRTGSSGRRSSPFRASPASTGSAASRSSTTSSPTPRS